MKVDVIVQNSRIYKYEGEEEKQKVLDTVNKEVIRVKTDLAMQHLYDKAEVEVIEVEGGFQIQITLRIPKLV